MFGRTRGQHDVDEMFGLLSSRMDRIEHDIVPTLQGQFDSMNNLVTQVSIHDNRISVLTAKTQSLVERVNRHLPALGFQQGTAAGAQPSSQAPAAEAQPSSQGPAAGEQTGGPSEPAQDISELLGLTAHMAEEAPLYGGSPPHLALARLT